MGQALLWAAGGTGFTFLMTVLGAAMVFIFRKEMTGGIQKIFLGFAAGVMIAASVWSLLIPAIEEAEAAGAIGWIPAAGGFIIGNRVFVRAGHADPPPAHRPPPRRRAFPRRCGARRCSSWRFTLHNIPEGMAVGLSFARAAQHGGDIGLYASALALALGIGIQNFPEGAAVSLPLRQEGMRVGRSFVMGSLSGIVEPIFGLATVLLAVFIAPYMPWMLAFAAGAMMYVVVEELIPRGASGRALQRGHHGRDGGLSDHDGIRRGAGIGYHSETAPAPSMGVGAVLRLGITGEFQIRTRARWGWQRLRFGISTVGMRLTAP